VGVWLVACGPEVGADSGSDSSSTSGASSNPTSSGVTDTTSGLADPSSSDATTNAASTGAADSSSTGEPIDYCAVCGQGEVCVERGSDGCGFEPEIHCVVAENCADPSCDDPACVAALCGDTDCVGFGAGGCFGDIGAFLCSTGLGIECDFWAQDCARGERCSAWSRDGGTRFDDVHCTSVPAETVGVGESCVVEDNATSGMDNCELGSQCLEVDPDTLVGTCRTRCIGSRADPSCEDPDMTCSVVGSTFAFCLP
jgi:hypothetical protein